jgi:predicted O-linked N-acetylglucosamine transferase (SPINDLY family)/predicted SAM-dependent methyltransferase
MLSSSLCNGGEYTANVEAAYIAMYKEICSENCTMTVSEEDIALAFEAAGLLFANKQYERAEDTYLDILNWRPGNSRALHALGMIEEKRGNFEAGIGYLQQAIELNPEFIQALLNLGNMLKKQGRFAEAENEYKKVIDINSDDQTGLVGLGETLWAQGRAEEAAYFFRRSHLSSSDNTAVASDMLFMLNYTPNVTPEEIFTAHAEWGDSFERKIRNYSHWTNSRDQSRTIRIGYVSGDLGIHPVGFFIVNPIRSHSRNKFQVICYSNRKGDDVITNYLKEQSDGWRDIHGRGDDEVCRLIRKDKIDILVDLAGHTGCNRLRVFARQPAPVQVSWLGYPNTTGLHRVQYRITDAIADPPGRADKLHTEQLVRLPTGFLSYFPSTEAPEIEPLPFKRNGFITFGSFNNLAKITPEVVAVWSRAMLAVPGSRLLMKRSTLRDFATVQRYLKMFKDNGIESDRIDLIPSTVTHTEHLRVYSDVDVALDSFPYNGTTTTCEALWMGVPVVVLAGTQHAGRVGMSILHRLSLDEYVASDENEYVEKVISISGDIEKLSQLRSLLRDRMYASPLCNSSGFCLSLENAYREMWKNWCHIAGCEQKERLALPQNKEGSRKLHIGGIARKKGWENFNALPDATVDHLGDAADLSRFEDNTFKEIYASHVLEHFEYQYQLKHVLTEWLRVLVPGGTLYLSVPNMDVFVEIWNKNGTTDSDRFFIMQMIFGGHKDAFDYHYSGFNEAILSKYLKEIGFLDICRRSHFGLFKDTSIMKFKGEPVSLNITARKPEIEFYPI